MSVNPYIALKEAYLRGQQAQQAAEQDRLKQQLEAAQKSANQTYDTSARQAYINYRQMQDELPNQLSNQGMTGGASESANVKLMSAYANALSTNDAARAAALAGLDTKFKDQLAELNNNYLASRNSAIANYDKYIADWEEEERRRQLAEQQAAAAAAAAAAARSYSSGGGGRSYSSGKSSGGRGSGTNYEDYADELNYPSGAVSGATAGLLIVPQAKKHGGHSGTFSQYTSSGGARDTSGIFDYVPNNAASRKMTVRSRRGRVR